MALNSSNSSNLEQLALNGLSSPSVSNANYMRLVNRSATVCVRRLREGGSVRVGKEVEKEENVVVDNEARGEECSLERGSDLHLVVKATARSLRQAGTRPAPR